MNANSYRKAYLRYHKRYEKKAFRTFLNVFKKWGKDIRWDDMTIFNYNEVLNDSIDEEDMFKAFETVYVNIGLTHGKRVGKNINSQLKFFTLDDFASAWVDFVKNWLSSNAGQHIESISRTYIKQIRQLFTEAVQEGKTIVEITSELKKLVNKPNFYRHNAMRIARTETTTSSNLATFKVAQNSDLRMTKMWISAQDMRTRRLPEAQFDHVQMHKQVKDLEDMFEVPNRTLESGALMFPGDQGQVVGGLRTTAAGNVINCRCTFAAIPKKDKNGNFIPK